MASSTKERRCLPEKLSTFTGRDKEVKKIVSFLEETDSGVISIYGEPGFGKSTIAIEACYRFRQEHANIPVFFTCLSHVSTMLEATQRLCHDVDIHPGEDAMYTWSEAIKEKTILVIDNIDKLVKDSERGFEDLVAKLMKQSNQQLLILTTSKDKFLIDLLNKLKADVLIKEMDKDVSVKLLKKHCRTEEVQNKYLSDLAKLCGYVPLALCIAASRIEKLETWLPKEPGGHVQDAITMSFERFNDENKVAFVRLSVLGGNFNEDAAQEIIGRSQLQTKNFLKCLVDLNLIECRAKQFLVHSLVQSFLSNHDKFKGERTFAQVLMMMNSPEKIDISVLDMQRICLYHKREIIKARSLALRFMAANPSCIRAIPHADDDDHTSKKTITMLLYVYTSTKESSDNLQKNAEEMFKDFKFEFVNLKQIQERSQEQSQKQIQEQSQEQLNEEKKEKGMELAKLAKIIEKNLDIFENRLNVTAVQPSYKIVQLKETSEVCVRVFVVGKGKIPIGETDFSKVKKLNGYPFDIVEGYYLPSTLTDEQQPKNASIAIPLRGGVGIGVNNQDSAGTLGCFLKDEDDNCYLLSCQHVLSSEQNTEIVQPAKYDYSENETISAIKDDIRKRESVLKSLQKLHDDAALDGQEKNRIKEQIATNEENNKLLNKPLKEALESRKPRVVGEYSCGLRENIPVNDNGDNNTYTFVDAAIAKLTTNEKDLIEQAKPENGCTVYGFTDNSGKTVPTGGIVSWLDFHTLTDLELVFTKWGRTTGCTDCGKLEPGIIFLLDPDTKREGLKKSTCVGKLGHSLYKIYCIKCQPTGQNYFIDTNDVQGILCEACGETIELDDKWIEFWSYNCRTIKQTVSNDSFASRGDSGSLVFDNHGRAWGIIYAVFKTPLGDLSIVTSLEVSIQELEKLSKKKLHLWRRTSSEILKMK